MKKNFVLFLSIFSISLFSSAQGFTEVSAALNINVINPGPTNLGVGMSFCDFDRDGWDDLTFTIRTDSILFYRNLGGTGFERIELFPNLDDAKQPSWVDYDNDGDADFMISKRNSGTRLYRNDGNFEFTDVTASLNLPSFTGINIYGFSWADYDRDGWLDVYLCAYNSQDPIHNYLCHNNGNGTFSEVSVVAGVDNGVRVSFQSVFQDFNNDNWPDLYVINDLNQINSMYFNNGDGTFTDVTIETQTGISAQCMSNSICDFDHDGDWDIYISNNIVGNYLLRNDNGVFTNIAASAGVVVNSFCWGALWIDYDHNTWDDLHIGTATNILNQDWFFLNNGDATFSNANFSEFANNQTYSYSSAKGDFNNDGFWDFGVTKVAATDHFELYQGIPNANHWLKLQLQGTMSNRDAIGTLIEYYIDGEKNIQYTRCGDNFLAQQSTYPILSLSNATSIDSLVITWPRGLVERIYNISSDQTLSLIEGDHTIATIAFDGPQIICGSEGATLDAGNWAQYAWSTDQNTRYVTVYEAGTYTVEVTDSSGFISNASIEVSFQETLNGTFNVTIPTCNSFNDGSIVFSLDNGNLASLLWENGETNSERSDLMAGDYSLVALDQNGCSFEGSIQLDEPPAITSVETLSNVTCYGFEDGSALLSLSGGTGPLQVDWAEGIDPTNLAVGNYSYSVSDENGCVLNSTFSIEEPDSLGLILSLNDVSCFGLMDGTASIISFGGTGIISIDWQGQDPNQLGPNDYSVVVTDEAGCTLVSDFSITEPAVLSMSISVTDANNGNNGSAEASVSGGTLPYSYSWTSGAVDSVANDLGQGVYICEVMDANGCAISGTATILDVSVTNYEMQQSKVFPNPSSGMVSLENISNSIQSIRILDSSGRIVDSFLRLDLHRIELDVTQIQSGLYLFEIQTKRGIERVPWIKE